MVKEAVESNTASLAERMGRLEGELSVLVQSMGTMALSQQTLLDYANR